jgi:3-keto-disaccharide hydrolase
MSRCQASTIRKKLSFRAVRTVALALMCGCGALGREHAADAQEVPSYAREVPSVRTGEPVLRFNGKDLSGFYTYLHDSKYDDPKKVFTVKDGVLDISGEEFGGLTTRDEFRDYVLIVEWKWGERTFSSRKRNARDSGLLLHCVGPDGAAGGNWMESQECQIIEGGCGDFIMVGANGSKPSLTCETRRGPDGQYYFEKGGKSETRDSGRFNWWGRDPAWKDVLGFRGARDIEKPAGEWNRMEVICDGDSITNIVNGYVANAATRSSLAKGKVIIQSEGAEILFRKIEIRPLLK